MFTQDKLPPKLCISKKTLSKAMMTALTWRVRRTHSYRTSLITKIVFAHDLISKGFFFHVNTYVLYY